jgi:hypothetical protein
MSATGKNVNPYLLTLPQLISAKKKIGYIASFYDPSSSSLRGFDSDALDPTQFREQLRRNFLIRLTDEELGAIVLLFDKDGDGKVDSIEFINEFFRLGKIEKEKARYAQKKEEERLERNRVKRLQDHAKRFEKLAPVKVPDKWNEDEEISACQKIARLAFSYDPFKPFSSGLEVSV